MWGSEADKARFGALYPLFEGPTAGRDHGRGIKTIQQLAGAGYVPAIFTLGMAYFDHRGVHRNYRESFRLYMIAAQADYPSAQCGVGNFYAMAYPKHDACANDPVQAAQWWLRAAQNGNPGAQANLASAYLRGSGVPREPLEAYIWAVLGVHCSTIRFRSAEVYRDQARAELDPPQLSAAQVRIAALQAQLPLPWSEHTTYWLSLYQQSR